MDIKELNEDVVRTDISINSTVEDIVGELYKLREKNKIEINSHRDFILKDLFFREVVYKINGFI